MGASAISVELHCLSTSRVEFAFLSAMRRFPALIFVALLAGLAPPPKATRADTIAILPDRDNTLYEDPAGSLSNGSGHYLFAGLTLFNVRRRALLRFDVAGALPPGAMIQSAAMTLTMSRGGSSPTPVALHRVLANWGEGGSIAAGEEGMGAAIQPGEAGWIHSVYPTTRWNTPGGDFDGAESSTANVGNLGPFTWGSTALLVANLNDMFIHPATNFGFVLIGSELDVPPTAKRFNSRENPDAATRPMLTINYTVPGPGAGAVLMGAGMWGMRRRRGGRVGG